LIVVQIWDDSPRLVCEVHGLDLGTEGQILNLFLGFGLVLSLEIWRSTTFEKR